MEKGTFLSNVFALAGSNVVAQSISVLASLVLARLYSPTEMGVYSSYISLASIFSIFACLQYDQAIVLPEDIDSSRHLFRLCTRMAIGTAMLSGCIAYLSRFQIGRLLHSEELSNWVILLPLSVIITGMSSALLYWNMRRETMGIVAKTNLVAVTVTTLSQIAMGVDVTHMFGGMIFGQIIGTSVAAVILYTKSRVTLRESNGNCIRGTYKQLLSKYRKFPRYTVPQKLFDTGGSVLPNLLLGALYDQTVTGYYALSYRILALPISVISGAISQAFLPKVVTARREGKLQEVSFKMYQILLELGLVPFLLVALVAPQLIGIAFGEKWVDAGTYVRVLTPSLLVIFVFSPLSSIFLAMEKQKESMLFHMATTAARAIMLVAAGMIASPAVTVLTSSIVIAIIDYIGILYLLKLSGSSIANMGKESIRAIMRSIPYFVPTIVVMLAKDTTYICVIVAILSGIAFLALNGKRFLHELERIDTHTITDGANYD